MITAIVIALLCLNTLCIYCACVVSSYQSRLEEKYLADKNIVEQRKDK